MDKNNAIYVGKIRHRRFKLRKHEFSYRLFMLYCNVKDIEKICENNYFSSFNKPNISSFYEKDFFPDIDGTLEEKINKVLIINGYSPCEGKMYLLSNWRYFSYQINPISCYYCFDAKDQLQYMVLEVTNTPWGERVNYVLSCDPKNKIQRLKFMKKMHVSPFYPMDMVYSLNCNIPGVKLSMHINNFQQGDVQFDATLGLEKKSLTAANLNSVLVKYPFMTLKVLIAIYWQALKIWLKGVPYISPPEKQQG